MDQRVDFCAQTGDFQQLSRHEGKDTEVESRSSNGIQGKSSKSTDQTIETAAKNVYSETVSQPASRQEFDHAEKRQPTLAQGNNSVELRRQKARDRKRKQRGRLTPEQVELTRKKNRDRKRLERANLNSEDLELFTQPKTRRHTWHDSTTY